VAAGAQDLRVTHVTIVSPERAYPARDTTISIHDGRIVASVRTANVIDGHGLFLAPGLIDSHVHLHDIPGMTAEQGRAHPEIARAARDQIPKSFLYSGFTTLLDLNGSPAELADWKTHEPRPDTYFCGGAIIKDGYPMNFVPKPQRYTAFPYMIVDTDSSAAAAVAHMQADGARCVKTFYERGFGPDKNLPLPSLHTIRALVRAAHAVGLPVFVHANGAVAQTFALDAGADVIAHGMWHWDGEPRTDTILGPSEEAILDRVISTHTGWQPTIQVLYGESNLFSTRFLSDPRLAKLLPASLIAWYGTKEGQWYRDAYANGATVTQAQADADEAPWIARVEHATRYLVERHARLLFGTDTPSAPTYANPPGLNAWLEMQNLIDCGETPLEIFQSATLANARALKLDRDIGTVQLGKRANLLLLREDPTQTIHAYTTIVTVILGGRLIVESDISAEKPPAVLRRP
jgi:imidazolonepropionase-like amidohydrolase